MEALNDEADPRKGGHPTASPGPPTEKTGGELGDDDSDEREAGKESGGAMQLADGLIQGAIGLLTLLAGAALGRQAGAAAAKPEERPTQPSLPAVSQPTPINHQDVAVLTLRIQQAEVDIAALREELRQDRDRAQRAEERAQVAREAMGTTLTTIKTVLEERARARMEQKSGSRPSTT